MKINEVRYAFILPGSNRTYCLHYDDSGFYETVEEAEQDRLTCIENEKDDLELAMLKTVELKKFMLLQIL